MSTTVEHKHVSPTPLEPPAPRPGPLGRLGVWVTDHARITTVVWLLLIVGLGAFAPRVEAELSGAGWQADGSESVAVRELAQDHFGGQASTAIQVVVHSDRRPGHRGRGSSDPCRGRPGSWSRTPGSPRWSNPNPARR